MARTTSTIRLVGGGRGLDATVVDLSVSAPDRADAQGDRFVRAVRGTTVASLAALRDQCHDRHRAEELAREWQVAVFTAGRDRSHRARIYRYQGTYPLAAGRDERGRWTLDQAGAAPAGTAPGGPSTWAQLEAAVDEAARRFEAVAALLPDGALAERADTAGRAVAGCVADAARLCAVGAAVAPDWQPSVAADQGRMLADRVMALASTIDAATAHVVELHLEVGDVRDPSEPVAHLRAAWTELES